MRVAVLGTGAMGAGMARSLQSAGHEVAAWNRSPEKSAPLAADGIEVAASAEAAVDGADAVLTVLFDVDSVLETMKPLVAAFPADAVWIQASTVGVDGIASIAALAGQHHIPLLDSPVLGTKDPAANGKLVVLVSGDPAAQQRVQPVFDAIGSKTLSLGPEVGSASALKLAANSWVLTLTAAVAQSLALAKALGVDPTKFLEAISGGPLDTPYAQLKGKAMLSDSFESQFAVDNARKDLDLILAAAAKVDVAAGVLAAVSDRYQQTSDGGSGGDDIAAVFRSF